MQLLNSVKESILDALSPTDDGKTNPNLIFLITCAIAFFPCLYIGLKCGFYAGLNPRVEGISVILEAMKAPWYYAFKFGNPFNPAYLGIFMFLFFIIAVYSFIQMDLNKNRSDKSKGSAHWNSLRKYNPVYTYPKNSPEVEEVPEEDRYEPGNMILGKDLYFDLNQKGTNIHSCSLIVGATGSGKSFGYVKPNIMQMNASFIVTDPAGDLTRECGKLLINHGYGVSVFNTAELQHSCRYNPFRYIRDEQGIMTMVKVFMENTKDIDAGKGDQFFDKAEQCFYLAIFFYIYTEYKDQPEKQNFNTVFKMYLEANASEDSKKENELNDFDRRFIALAEKDKYHPALKFYNIFKKGTGKTLKSILISAGVRLSFLAVPSVADLLAGDDLELETIGDRKRALFMIIKAEDSTYNFLSAMLFTQLFETLYYVAGQQNPSSWLLTKGNCTALKSERFKTSAQKATTLENLKKEQKRYQNAFIRTDDENAEEFQKEDENGILPWPKSRIVVNEDGKEVVLKEFIGKREAEIFLDAVQHGEIKQGDKVLTCHTRFLLDEFANIGTLPEFDKKLATFRKYRISSDIILQSLSQLKKIYEDNQGLIISNCSIIICLATNDYDDCEWFSKLLGQKTVNVRSRNVDTKGLIAGTSGGSIQSDAENLMRPEDIRTMPKDECLVIVSGQAPFKVKKFRATDHPRWDEMNSEQFEYRQLFNTAHSVQMAVTAESLTQNATQDKGLTNKKTFKEQFDNFLANRKKREMEDIISHACQGKDIRANETISAEKLPMEAQERLIKGIQSGKHSIGPDNILRLNTGAGDDDTVADVFDSFF